MSTMPSVLHLLTLLAGLVSLRWSQHRLNLNSLPNSTIHSEVEACLSLSMTTNSPYFCNFLKKEAGRNLPIRKAVTVIGKQGNSSVWILGRDLHLDVFRPLFFQRGVM